MNKLPQINDQRKICIICEGPEEYEYFDKLKSLGVWNKNYDIKLDNAKGNGNIPARYQNIFQNGSYDIVLIFCDTDRKPYEQYEDIKRKINEFHGIDNAGHEIVIFGNPCTMQIVLGHWGSVSLCSQNKRKNAPIIETYTGVKNYKGRADQRQQIYEQITKINYKDMCERVKTMPNDDTQVGSSNFGKYIDYLCSEDDSWIEEINKKLEC